MNPYFVNFSRQHERDKGKKHCYRATLRHGVSEILTGERYTPGIIFHDASN